MIMFCFQPTMKSQLSDYLRKWMILKKDLNKAYKIIICDDEVLIILV